MNLPVEIHGPLFACFGPKASFAKGWKPSFQPGSTDCCISLVLCNPLVHRYQSLACFGLKPLEFNEHRAGLQVKCHKLKKRCAATIFLPSPKFVFAAPNGSSGEIVPQRFTACPSGEIIETRTAMPETNPLPNFKILELHWLLQCAVAMRLLNDAAENVNSVI